MSRMFDYGPGELYDRLSILRLKIHHAPVGRDTLHFSLEQQRIMDTLDRLKISPNLFQLALSLARVNGWLWDAEDQMRQFRQDGVGVNDPVEWYESVALLGLRINKLNADRSELIAEINRVTGHRGGPEKIR
jgi:hypothetical protein